MREFGRLVEGAEKLLGLVTLGVFDLLEVEEADSRVAPEYVVPIVLYTC